MTPDDLAKRLFATFLAELDEQVQAMNADLLALETVPGDAARLKALFRVAHTLKGAARAAGVPVVEQVCHLLESRLVPVRDGAGSLDPALLATLFSAADALADAGKRLREGKDLDRAPIGDLRRTLRSQTHAPPADVSAPKRPATPAATPEPPPPASSTAAAAGGSRASDSQVRVDASKLDDVVASSSQLVEIGERLARRAADAGEIRDLVSRWAAEIRRRGGARARRAAVAAASPSDASPSAWDEHLRRLARETDRLASESAADVQVYTRTAGELHDRVRRLRLRPVQEAFEALPRTVRDIATGVGKEVRLETTGGDVEADRAVLDGLREAVLQLVRNAIDHGIETPEARAAQGKATQGTVHVSAALRGDRLSVAVSDDGAGLRLGAVRDRLRQQGRDAPPADADVIRALLEGGVSTRAQATAISGRGVGLDIVRAAAERIRGVLTVASEPGRGTTFTLECPPTLVTVRAVIATVGTHPLAIPVSHVERLRRIRPDEIARAEGRDVIPDPEGPVPLVTLARLLGPPFPERTITGPMLVVMLRAGERRLAAVVDDLISEQEVVLRPVAGGARPMPHVSGAALLGSGEAAIVLNPASLIATGLGLGAAARIALAEAPGAAQAKKRILVVDDSITTRTLEQSILEAAGYDVRTAVDGADAWRLLQEEPAELVVSDVEMPRMDGFALCEAIRASKRFKDLPVVLVSALAEPEHRARGLDVGADAYLGKSSFDQRELLAAIRQLLG